MNPPKQDRELPGDSYWVVEDKLLAGPYPGAPSDEEAREKLAAFHELGVTLFLDLTEKGEGPPLRPYAHLSSDLAKEAGREVLHLRITVPDLTAPSVEQMREALDVIRSFTDAGRLTYVHCWGGVGRTGAVIGCHLVESGLAPEEAIERIAELRRGTDRAHRTSPETPDQRALIESWSPRGGA